MIDDLKTGDKIVIFFTLIILIFFGIITLRSLIIYDSPFLILNDFFSNTSTPKTDKKSKLQIIDTKKAVIKEDINFRPSPNTDSIPIRILKSGTVVNVISVENGWAKIYDDTETEGFVVNNYLIYND